MKYSEFKEYLQNIPMGRISVLPVESVGLMYNTLNCICYTSRGNKYRVYLNKYTYYCTIINTSSGYFLKIQKD